MQSREPREVVARDCCHVAAAAAAAFILMPRHVFNATLACHEALIIAPSTQDVRVQFVIPAYAVIASELPAFRAEEWPIGYRPYSP